MVFGYVRVSSIGQALNGNGLEAQRRAVQDAGATEIIEDVYTGTTADRPGLRTLLDRVQAGDEIIAVKIDRLARNVSDGCTLIADLLDRGVAVRILNLGRIDDTPTGRLTLHIMLAFAEYEKDIIKERLTAGREVARQKPGYREGRPQKFSEELLTFAIGLLSCHSYTEVSRLTGISKSTLIRAKRTHKNDSSH